MNYIKNELEVDLSEIKSMDYRGYRKVSILDDDAIF
jgi:hypothetical protein